jgi:hypothetical protein
LGSAGETGPIITAATAGTYGAVVHARIETMYTDKLDGLPPSFDKQSAAWSKELP